jgi:hypothetical protein
MSEPQTAASIAQAVPSGTSKSLAHVSQILSTVATLMGRGPAGVDSPGLPLTPSHHLNTSVSSTEQPTASPLMNTPSKLKHFLEHAEKYLDVANATNYTFLLSSKGYGPDILHCIKEESLIELGIPHGDVIRLQDNASKWWNGPDAKRKSSCVENDEPTKKCICFEKHYCYNRTTPRLFPNPLRMPPLYHGYVCTFTYVYLERFLCKGHSHDIIMTSCLFHYHMLTAICYVLFTC